MKSEIVRRVFARPHPQATAGRPVSLQYSPDSRVSVSVFQFDQITQQYFPILYNSHTNILQYSPDSRVGVSVFQFDQLSEPGGGWCWFCFHLIVFKVLDYQFMPDLSIDAPTILYVPPLIYSNGYSLEVKAILNQDLMVQ